MKFFKLLKYEILDNLAPILLINGILLVLILTLRFLFTEQTHNPATMALFVIIPICIFISIVFLIMTIVKSLYQRLFSQEGYLTLSLPVGIDSILISKIITSLIWIVLTNIIVSLFVVFIIGIEDSSIYAKIYDFLSEMFGSYFFAGLFIVLTNLITIISLITLVLFIISLLNIGKINRFRILIGILLFLLFIIIESVISAYITQYVVNDYENFMRDNIYSVYKDDVIHHGDLFVISPDLEETIKPTINYMLIRLTMPYMIFSAIMTLFYYICSRYLIKNKLEI